MATTHRSILIYVFDCTFPNVSTHWLDDPSSLITAIRNALANVADLTYKTLKISNVRNSSIVNLEVHIDGALKNSSANLTSADVDTLRLDIMTQLDNILTFTYSRVDIVNNLFYEDPA